MVDLSHHQRSNIKLLTYDPAPAPVSVKTVFWAACVCCLQCVEYPGPCCRDVAALSVSLQRFMSGEASPLSHGVRDVSGES